MKILILTPRFPYPPARGDCIRAWGEVRHLARRHDVWLAALNETQPAAESLEAVAECCREVAVFARGRWTALGRGALRLAAGGTITEGFFSDPRLAQKLREWALRIEFDAVLAFSSAMAPNAASIPARRRVLDMNDVDSVKWERYAERACGPARWIYGREGQRLAACEREWSRQFDCTVVVNARERDRLERRCRPRSAAVVRTGVEIPAEDELAAGLAAGPLVGFVGSMSYPPNVRAALWFGANVWPRVLRAVPGARWEIVGREPTRAVRGLARLAGVTVTGAVEDVRPRLRAMRVFVAPMLDDLGVQTKLIEAFSWGRPAVATEKAAAGMEWRGERPLLVADEPGAFAECVVRVLRDEQLAGRLARAAFRTAREFYDASREVRRIERLLTGEADGERVVAGARRLRVGPQPDRAAKRRVG